MLVLLTRPGQPARAAADAPPNSPQFAFWYETWRSDSWAKLQPANVIIGVPPEAVADIHAHGGRALRYVTFYQSTLGTAFLHDRADLANVGFHTPAGFLPSAFGRKDNYVLCSNSTELHRRVLAYVDETVGQDGYDGLFIDNAYLPPARDEACDAKHAHLTAGTKGGPAYIDLLTEVRAAVKQRKPAAILFLNPGNPRDADKLTSDKNSLWDVSDYVLWESYAYSSLLGGAHDRREATIAQSMAIATSSHANKVVALAYPRTFPEALFSFAVARAFGFDYAANLGETDFQREHEGGHFGIFLQDLPSMIGPPESPLHPDNDLRVLQRRFRNGVIVVNMGAAPWSLKAPRSAVLYSPAGRSEIRAGKKVAVAPDTAVVLSFH